MTRVGRRVPSGDVILLTRSRVQGISLRAIKDQLPVFEDSRGRGLLAPGVRDLQPPLPGGILAPVVDRQEGPVVESVSHPVLGPGQQEPGLGAAG